MSLQSPEAVPQLATETKARAPEPWRVIPDALSVPVPPEPHRLMTNVDATLGQQVLDLAQR